jgi:hypothetical protein
MAVLAATLVGLSLGANKAPEPEKASLNGLAWLAGNWEAVIDGARLEEHWTEPAGSLMIGMGRQTTGQRTDYYEFLRVEEKDGGITYYARVGSQPEVPFQLTELKDKEAVFENPQHDYPKRIVYRLESGGVLFVHVEGGKKGKTPIDEYRLKRKN